MDQYLFQRKYINLILGLGIAILLLLSVISFYQIRALIRAQMWITHTYQVLEASSRLFNDLSYVESRQRGYLLIGNKTYINNSQTILQDVYQQIPRLQILTQDNPAQYERVNQLIPFVLARVQRLNFVFKIVEEKGVQAAINIAHKGRGEELTIKIVQILTTLTDEEKRLLDVRNQTVKAYTYKTAIFLLLASTLSLGLILVGFILLNKQLNYRDKTEKKLLASEEDLFRLAYYDTLTGLPNRILLIKDVDKAISRTEPNDGGLALLLIDLDNFKNINDSMGPEVGDNLLRQFALRLMSKVRTDDIISHTAGDKFIIVLKNIDSVRDVTAVVKKIMESMRDPLLISHHTIYVTASIGISIYPNNGTDAKTLMKNADIAMYKAKELGKNTYQYCTPEMTLEVEQHALLDVNLHQALANNEFILLYQPKLSLKTGKASGVEALMRWKRPQVGLVNPTTFIALAERNGLIVPIGEWMIRSACIQGKKWHDAGYKSVVVAVNISTRQILISDLAGSVKRILNETGFDPKFLEIEITESILMKNDFNNLTVLRTLKDMGIKITLDDFGTGFSSLSYLSSFSVDKLKIDQSFVREIQTSTPNSSIVSAIIVMAHSLGIEVVAEGVETLLQVDFLKKYHCDELQGYFYSRPVTADEAEVFFNLH